MTMVYTSTRQLMEADLRDTGEAIGATPAHQDHGKSRIGNDKSSERFQYYTHYGLTEAMVLTLRIPRALDLQNAFESPQRLEFWASDRAESRTTLVKPSPERNMLSFNGLDGGRTFSNSSGDMVIPPTDWTWVRFGFSISYSRISSTLEFDIFADEFGVINRERADRFRSVRRRDRSSFEETWVSLNASHPSCSAIRHRESGPRHCGSGGSASRSCGSGVWHVHLPGHGLPASRPAAKEQVVCNAGVGTSTEGDCLVGKPRGERSVRTGVSRDAR